MRICFISLGCDKNLVDSEYMLGLLVQAGHTLTEEEDQAEAIIVNTCCFVHDAKQESVEAILQAAEYKKQGACKILLVTGCLAERYKEEILSEIPEVDGLLGTASFDEIAAVLKSVQTRESEAASRVQCFKGLSRLPLPDVKRVNTTCGYYAYLKIADGCEKHCTYCVIPSIRGEYRSVPMERLLEEAKQLAADGCKELVLVAQETTLYGVDLYGEKRLPALLTALCQIDGIEWIRLLYCYPEEITSELIATMKREKKICRYLDLPIQHASDAILRSMGRRTTKKELTRLIKRLRRELPGISLRTTLITGFPGETESDHQELLAFVEEMRFDRLGVFPYSKEEGTPAARRKDQIPKKVKLRRQKELMLLQQQIAFSQNESRIGKLYTVMVEGYLEESQVYLARTYMDAPGVDGYFFLSAGVSPRGTLSAERKFVSGDFVRARVTGAKGYDLMGVCVNKGTR